MKYEETKYGFIYGALNVTRVASDDAKGWTVIEAKSPKTTVQVFCTKTGKIRIYRDGKELK
jgi:hypothetical protein